MCVCVSVCASPQGYGLTETCAASFISFPFDWDQNNTVGPPMPHVKLRLEAVPEMGYDPTANPPRGEVRDMSVSYVCVTLDLAVVRARLRATIVCAACVCVCVTQVCIGGPGLFNGYYKEPTMTKEAMGA